MAEGSRSGSVPDAGAADPAPAAGSLPDGETLAPLSPLMARVDVAVAALITLVAAAISLAMPQLVASGGIDIQRDFATLPGYLVPQLAFAALALVALFSIFPAIRRLKAAAGLTPADEGDRLRRAGVMVVIAAAYAAGINTLGYILDTMLMTAVLAFYLGLRNPLAFIPGVFIVPFLIRFIFERLLLISLPPSQIEIVGNIEEAVLHYFARLLLH